MDALSVGDPWLLSTDCGPVIDEQARQGIADHVAKARTEGRVLKELALPPEGIFVAPTLIEVPGINALEREIFGPVLHVARFKSHEIDQVIASSDPHDELFRSIISQFLTEWLKRHVFGIDKELEAFILASSEK